MANASGSNWQEDVYQKINSMKDIYLPALHDIHKRFTTRLQQEQFLPEQQRKITNDVKLGPFMTMLERMIQLLSVSKSNIQPVLKDKVDGYEKTIADLLNCHKQILEKRGQSSQTK
ncbi:unnamed protein product [Arabis nemorensis]|uniref:Uncharacterized protein n=1 Tax=Arabis nemorensis TaxID=586526 RepID=A0A565APY6_9BRAS|nr:unnamed protein product [Arabis nemorensis]